MVTKRSRVQQTSKTIRRKVGKTAGKEAWKQVKQIAVNLAYYVGAQDLADELLSGKHPSGKDIYTRLMKAAQSSGKDLSQLERRINDLNDKLQGLAYTNSSLKGELYDQRSKIRDEQERLKEKYSKKTQATAYAENLANQVVGKSKTEISNQGWDKLAKNVEKSISE